MGFFDNIDYDSQEDENIYLSDSKKGFELIAKLIANVENKEEVSKLLDKMRKFVDEDFTELCRSTNLLDQIEIYRKLRSIYSDIKDMTEFSALANKNIVALGGGFSSGKSRFINTILNDDILPTETTPTTSIPTYIRNGNEEKIYALNTFNVKADVDREAIKAISHDFNKQYDISFSHVIKLLMLETPYFKYNNIAILDTPGYSKADSLQDGFNTDERKAREHLSQADYLIWVVDIQKGTLPDSDIEFIRSLDYEGEIFFILNRADLRPPKEREEIMSNVKERIKSTGIKCCGILLFTSVEEQNELGGDSIFSFFETINTKVKSTNIKKRFKKLTTQMLNHISEEKETLKETVGYFNKLILDNTGSSNDLSAVREVLNKTKEQVKKQEMSISRLISFSDKFNEAIDKILNKICVVDEIISENGIEIYQTINNKNKVISFEIDGELEGKVKTINPFGVFIQSKLGEEIMVTKGDIAQKYTTSYKELFTVGESCKIVIKDIEHSKNRVKLLVFPNI